MKLYYFPWVGQVGFFFFFFFFLFKMFFLMCIRDFQHLNMIGQFGLGFGPAFSFLFLFYVGRRSRTPKLGFGKNKIGMEFRWLLFCFVLSMFSFYLNVGFFGFKIKWAQVGLDMRGTFSSMRMTCKYLSLSESYYLSYAKPINDEDSN